MNSLYTRIYGNYGDKKTKNIQRESKGQKICLKSEVTTAQQNTEYSGDDVTSYAVLILLWERIVQI